MRLNKLLSPGKIGTLELKNRFVVPPMGTNFATYEVFSDNAASQGYEPTHVVRQLQWMLYSAAALYRTAHCVLICNTL